jgi:hypothetical protein
MKQLFLVLILVSSVCFGRDDAAYYRSIFYSDMAFNDALNSSRPVMEDETPPSPLSDRKKKKDRQGSEAEPQGSESPGSLEMKKVKVFLISKSDSVEFDAIKKTTLKNLSEYRIGTQDNADSLEFDIYVIDTTTELGAAVAEALGQSSDITSWIFAQDGVIKCRKLGFMLSSEIKSGLSGKELQCQK